MAAKRIIKSRHEYTIAWIAALHIERAAAIVMLDEEHGVPQDFQQPPSDPNSYSWGALGGHNVIIVSLASGVYGNTMAAVTVVELLGSFPLIKFGLLVGIGAGIPRKGYDIRLGDVVVGHPSGTSGGIIQYDLGKAKTDGTWERKDVLNRPPEILLKALGNLKAKHEVKSSKISQYIDSAGKRHPVWKAAYSGPDRRSDRLFEANYDHEGAEQDCSKCSTQHEVTRSVRDTGHPMIHYGVIASGNSLVKDVRMREKIAHFNEECICLEMEAAGIVNSLPCMVIRGICDYADSHKNDHWQRYAAACAAAFAKELLECVPEVKAFPSGEPLRGRDTLRNMMNDEAQNDKEDEEKLRIHNSRRGELAKKIAQLLPQLYTSRYADRKNRNIKRIPNTCEWFINHHHFLHWYKSPSSSLLWVSADPGCGKSVLARFLIDEKLPASNRTICYFFFKDDSIEERKSSTALCALLHQLLKQKPELHQHPAIETLLMHGDRYVDAFWELWNAFIAIVTDSKAVGEVICVIDALDECAEGDRDDLIQAINDLDFTADAKGHLKIILTSRPYEYMRRSFHELISRMPVIHLSGEGDEETNQIREEIGLVVRHRVKQIGEEKNLTADELEFLLEQLTAVENRTYLWVYITIDIIRKASSFDRATIRRIISDVPQSLDEAYERILRECPDESKARLILGVILAAQGPLFVDDISLILALRADHQDYQALKVDMEPSRRTANTIRNLCGLFVVIKDEKVYLLHQTAREFLLRRSSASKETHQATAPLSSQQNLQNWIWKWSFDINQCHKLVAAACVRFLRLAISKQAEDEVFITYAAEYWTDHLKEAGLVPRDQLIRLALDLCDAKFAPFWFKHCQYPPSLRSALRTLDNRTDEQHLKPSHSVSLAVPPNLMIAAWSGVLAMVQLQLESKTNVNAVDNDGNTALSWAIREGNLDIVCLLLSKGARTHGKDLYPGAQPLHLATTYRQVAMIVPLLDNGAELTGKNGIGLQAIHLAACCGDANALRTLLERGADVNAKDRDGCSVLQLAIDASQFEIIPFLLDRGAMINSRSKKGVTALYQAAMSSNESLVRSLLARGAKPDLETVAGWTSLMVATREGSINIMQLLLDSGASIAHKSKRGQTVLHVASREGRLDVIMFLLEKGAKINVSTKTGRLPLHEAADFGHSKLVELFLDRKLQTDALDGLMRTPLWWAACSGDYETTKLLLDRGGQVNAVDDGGLTALGAASSCGHANIVKLLLESGAKVDVKSSSDQTPLHLAAYAGKGDVVRMLLEHGAQVDHRNTKGISALDMACEKSRKQAILALVEYHADTKHPTYFGETCLHMLIQSSGRRSKSATQAIIRAGADMKARDWSGRSPALYACLEGQESLVKLFLEEGLGVNEAIGFGLASLSTDLESSNASVYVLLKDYLRRSNPSSIWRGWTLLHAAAYSARASLVQYLLDAGAEVDKTDDLKHTPLYWALVGSEDNLSLSAGDRGVEMPYFWTKFGMRQPPFINSEFGPSKEARLKELYPMGYSAAQLRTVAILLAHGANPKVKGINWRYAVLPGLRRYAKERKEMLDLLNGTREQAQAVANRLAEGNNKGIEDLESDEEQESDEESEDDEDSDFE